ncbi:MAG TPA: hypothetical protein VF951_08030, partial [Streptosporangiaceae bacterium]
MGIQPGPGRSTWAWRRLLLLARGGRALVGPHRQAGDGGGGLVGVHRPQHDRGPAVQFGVVQVAARVVLAEESDNPVPVRSPAVAAAPGRLARGRAARGSVTVHGTVPRPAQAPAGRATTAIP